MKNRTTSKIGREDTYAYNRKEREQEKMYQLHLGSSVELRFWPRIVWIVVHCGFNLYSILAGENVNKIAYAVADAMKIIKMEKYADLPPEIHRMEGPKQ